MTLPRSTACTRQDDQARRTLARSLRLAYPPECETGTAECFGPLLSRLAEGDAAEQPGRDADQA